MPSVTQEEPLFYPSKKRRRDDDSGPCLDGNLQLYDALSCRRPSFSTASQSSRQFQASDHSHHYVRTSDGQILLPDELFSSPLLARKALPNPQPAKRFRLDDDGAAHSPPREQRRPIATPYSRQHHNHHPHKSALGAQPQSVVNPPEPASDSRRQPSHASSILAPCHICARRPTKKSDLDSFADCDGCCLRTCYVCMRECLGWGYDESRDEKHGDAVWLRGGNGHRQMICSRCCVEQGADGDVICLGCLQRR